MQIVLHLKCCSTGVHLERAWQYDCYFPLIMYKFSDDVIIRLWSKHNWITGGDTEEAEAAAPVLLSEEM